MPISAKRKLVVGAAGLAVLAGSGGAYAAQKTTTNGSGTAASRQADRAAEQKAFLDDVAKRLNVTREQLDAAVKGAAEARIDAAVAAGKLTKEQGDAAKKRLESGGLPLLGGGPGLGGRGPGGDHGPGGGPGFGRRGGGFGFGLDAAATYLGLSEDALHQQLESGKSLADVAKAQNKDVAGLKAALKTAVTTQLDQAVKDGRLTSDQKAKILSDVDQRLDDVINGTGPKRPGGHWR